MSEHTGTHVDALSHMSEDVSLPSIDQMELKSFMGKALCIDLSNNDPGALISKEEVSNSLSNAPGHDEMFDFLFLYTDHFRRYYHSDQWFNGPGLSIEAAQWICELPINAFGVETMSPGVSGISNRQVHRICGSTGVTHYENLRNLHLLIGRGIFQFIGLPINIKGGTGSPVRAVAVFS